MHAQRLLVERGNKDVVPQLIALVKDNSVDEIGLNPAAIHALVDTARPGCDQGWRRFGSGYGGLAPPERGSA